MSGVEILGIAAAVLQIADLGAKVSVKLFGFARKIRGAAEKIDLISKEIAFTGALLQQLSVQLDKDSKTQVLRRELIDSANDIVRSCKEIFKNIDKAIDGNTGSKIILGLKQRIHYTYLESEIDALRMNLENLKSSISIMQNVLIYAEQLRNRERFPVLKEQQDLLRALSEEKFANEQRYDSLMRAIRTRNTRFDMLDFPDQANNLSSDMHVPLGNRSLNFEAPEDPNTSSLPRLENRITVDDAKQRDYVSFIAHTLEDIYSSRYRFDKMMRQRVHDGVLDLHWQEWAPYRQYYTDDTLLRKFKQLPELVRFWIRKLEEEQIMKQPTLAVPVVDVGSRRRASSTTGLPQPNIIVNADGSSRGRDCIRSYERTRSRSRVRRYEDEDEEDEEEVIGEILKRRGGVSHNQSPYHREDDETRKALERLKLYEAREEETETKYKSEIERRTQKKTKLLDDGLVEYGASRISDNARIIERRPRTGRVVFASLEDSIFTRLPRKYVSTQSLEVFELNWRLDEDDPDYVIVKPAVSPTLRRELYHDTAKRRDGWVYGNTTTTDAVGRAGKDDNDASHQRRNSLAIARSHSRGRNHHHLLQQGAPLSPIHLSTAGLTQPLSPPGQRLQRSHTDLELPTIKDRMGGAGVSLSFSSPPPPPPRWSRSPSPSPSSSSRGPEIDIDALVSQWTNLSAREIAQGQQRSYYS